MQKNNINYFLTGGTLLGAVRHKGFIPWDDDIDVVMPRNDYERFIDEYNKGESKFKVITYKNSDWYFFPFAKVMDQTTSVSSSIYEYKNMGVFVDIFPLEQLSGDFSQLKKEAKKIKKIRNRLYYKKMKISYVTGFFKRCALLLLKILYFSVSTKKTNIKIEKICKKYSSVDPEYVAVLSVMTYGEKEIMPSILYNSISFIEFEGHFLPAPSGYDQILRNLYGNYMELPPIERRKPHEQEVYKKN